MRLDPIIHFLIALILGNSIHAEDYSQKNIPAPSITYNTSMYPFNCKTVKQYDYRVGEFNYPWMVGRYYFDDLAKSVRYSWWGVEQLLCTNYPYNSDYSSLLVSNGYYMYNFLYCGESPKTDLVNTKTGKVVGYTYNITFPNRTSPTADPLLAISYYISNMTFQDAFAAIKRAWNVIYTMQGRTGGNTGSGQCNIRAMQPDNNWSPFIMWVAEGGGYGSTSSAVANGTTWSASFSGGGWSVSNKFTTTRDGYIRAFSGQQGFNGSLVVDGVSYGFDASSGNNGSNCVTICYLPAGSHTVAGSGATWDSGGGSELGFFVTNQTQDSMIVADTPSTPVGSLNIFQFGTTDTPTITWSVQ